MRFVMNIKFILRHSNYDESGSSNWRLSNTIINDAIFYVLETLTKVFLLSVL